jgi:ubiquinone biosynthesis protein COQ4
MLSTSILRATSTRGVRCLSSTRPYPEFVPLNAFENAFLAVGSAVMSLVDPRRGGASSTLFSLKGIFEGLCLVDMIAALGETTAGSSLVRLRDRMLESSEGRRILKQRPRINTNTVDLDALAKLPKDSFGASYLSWLERTGVTPDTREPVSCDNK